MEDLHILNIEELKAQAQEALESGDVAKAKELIAQIKALKEQEEERASLAAELDGLVAKKDEEKEVEAEADEAEKVDEVEAEADKAEQVEAAKEEDKKEEKRSEFDNEMKEIKNLEVNGFEEFIRSEGTEKRGLDTTNGSVLVPVDVVNDVLELKDEQADLTKYVTVQTVGTGQGKFPIAKRSRAILATKEELAEIADIDEPLFNEVKYEVETRVGKIALSNELLEDAKVDVVAYAKKQMQRMVRNTNNKGVLDVLSTFAKVDVADADGLKKVVNVELDPELDVKVLVNQDFYNYLDTLKDVNGRYLLQDAIAFDSGKSLFGKEVIVVSNKVAPTAAGTIGFAFVGDLQESVAYFKRSEITADWEKFDNYSKGLAVGVRSDYEQIDAEAGKVVNFPKA